jgi:hypothetical protein
MLLPFSPAFDLTAFAPLPLPPSTFPPPTDPGPPSPLLDLTPLPQPPLPKQHKELQVAIGYLLYYGRNVDSCILPATCALACEQASPTLSTMSRLDRLLGYVSSHPNARKMYRASDMILRVHSDASYLSHPRAGSVAGSVHYMGMGSSTNLFAPDPEAPVNHPVSAHSTRIPVIVSFVAEAEIAGVFAAARIALD